MIARNITWNILNYIREYESERSDMFRFIEGTSNDTRNISMERKYN